jgi:hypothetical protein
MSGYILSTANRFYAGIESNFGNPATVSAQSRFVASKFDAVQVCPASNRRDKNGSRTSFPPTTNGIRTTAFRLTTYLTSNSPSGIPSCDALFQSALGALPQVATGLTVASAPNGSSLQTAVAHRLSIGSAISYLGEIRFVTAVQKATSFSLNAPFSNTPATGTVLPNTAAYQLSRRLPSVTVYDYWDPAGAVSRIITGAVVNEFDLTISSGTHEFNFSGPAANLIDSASFASGVGGLTAFPAEPTLSQFDYSLVPGNLGQVWLGSTDEQVFTLTGARIRIANSLRARAAEFGSPYPLSIVPGNRRVTVDFTLLAQSDVQTAMLYRLAKNRVPVAALLQLGQRQGALMALYLPAVTMRVPSFDDSGQRLAWHFTNNQASGVIENELFMAFA